MYKLAISLLILALGVPDALPEAATLNVLWTLYVILASRSSQSQIRGLNRFRTL